MIAAWICQWICPRPRLAGDETGALPGPDRFLADLGGRLLTDGPAAGRRRPNARGAASDHRPPHLEKNRSAGFRGSTKRVLSSSFLNPLWFHRGRVGAAV